MTHSRASLVEQSRTDHSDTHRSYRQTYGHWTWAAPAVVLVVGAIYMTTVAGGFFSLTNWSGIGSWKFIGLDNYFKIFSRPELIGALLNTLLLSAGYLVFTNIFGLGFALALNRTLKSRYLLRTLVFMPVVIAPIAVSYIWKFIFAYEGPLNQFLVLLGRSDLQTDWLAIPQLALAAILVVMVWQSTGFAMVIYLAGLATVPIEIEEAAALDGAGVFRRFRSITVPLIKPSILIVFTLNIIQGLKVFDQVEALTGGGPSDATQTLATEVYLQTFVSGNFGFGAALALMLSVLIAIFTLIQQRLTRTQD